MGVMRTTVDLPLIGDLTLSRDRLRAVFRLKCVTLAALLAGHWLLHDVLPSGTQVPWIVLALVIALLAAGTVALWPAPVPRRLVVGVFAVEIVALTFGIQRSGGVDHVSAPLLYPLIITLCGLLLSSRTAIIAAIACSAAYLCMAAAEYHGLSVRTLPYGRPREMLPTTASVVAFFLIGFGVMVSFATRRLDRFYVRLEKLRRRSVTELGAHLERPLRSIREAALRLTSADAAERRYAQAAASAAAAKGFELVRRVLDESRAALTDANGTKPRPVPHREMAQEMAFSGDAERIFRAKAFLLLAILSFTVALGWLFPIPTRIEVSIATIAVALTGTIIALAWPSPKPRWLWTASLIIDTAGLSVAIHYGGGVEHVSGPILYAMAIGIAGLVVSGRAALIVYFTAVLLYVGVVVAEYAGVLTHRVDYVRPADAQLVTVGMVIIYLGIFTALITLTLRGVRESYERADAIRREAVGALAHDLKNPLAVVVGYAELMTDATEEERRGMAEGVLRAAEEALGLIHNALDAAAIEGRGLTLWPQSTDLGLLAAEVVARYQPLAHSHQAALRYAMPAAPVAVDVDAALIERVLGNIISNALKYGGQATQVEVASGPADDGAIIRVRDSGPGIPAATLAQLFQPFARGAATAQRVEGSGLGLSIARRFVEAHGGTIDVDSRLGDGTCITIRLPGSQRAPTRIS